MTQEEEVSNGSERCRARFEILFAAKPGHGASKTRRAPNSTKPRSTNLGIKFSSSPAVQCEETEAHRGSGRTPRTPKTATVTPVPRLQRQDLQAREHSAARLSALKNVSPRTRTRNSSKALMIALTRSLPQALPKQTTSRVSHTPAVI